MWPINLLPFFIFFISFTFFTFSINLFFAPSLYADNNDQRHKQTLYSFEDLEILQKEKNYREFFDHAFDIRPSLRDFRWKQMVKMISSQYTDQLLQEKSISSEDFQFVETIFEWPILKEYLPFLMNRADIGVLYFQKCLENEKKVALTPNPTATSSPSCFEKMFKFWQKSPELEHMGVKLGELIINHVPEENILDHFSYFEKAIKSEKMAPLCQKESIQKVLIAHFNRFKSSNPSEQSLKNEMRRIASQDCLKNIVPFLKIALDRGAEDLKEVSYQILCNLNECKKEEFNLFLIKYLLDGPSVGIIFNHAWNLVQKLGKDHEARKKVFEDLKKIDPLPSKLFSLADEKRKEIIMSHLYSYFPEYMDYYAETCLSYLKGTASFENGNPTVYCHELFSLAEEKPWINSSLKSSYLSIPYVNSKKAL